MLDHFYSVVLISILRSTEIISDQPNEVRRFQEVIGAHVGDQNQTTEERLITLRARLTIAERKKEQLLSNSNPDDASKSKRPFALRSIQAEIDHYNKMIKTTETNVLNEKKKLAEKSKPKSKKSK